MVEELLKSGADPNMATVSECECELSDMMMILRPGCTVCCCWNWQQ